MDGERWRGEMRWGLGIWENQNQGKKGLQCFLLSALQFTVLQFPPVGCMCVSMGVFLSFKVGYILTWLVPDWCRLTHIVWLPITTAKFVFIFVILRLSATLTSWWHYSSFCILAVSPSHPLNPIPCAPHFTFNFSPSAWTRPVSPSSFIHSFFSFLSFSSPFSCGRYSRLSVAGHVWMFHQILAHPGWDEMKTK